MGTDVLELLLPFSLVEIPLVLFAPFDDDDDDEINLFDKLEDCLGVDSDFGGDSVLVELELFVSVLIFFKASATTLEVLLLDLDVLLVVEDSDLVGLDGCLNLSALCLDESGFDDCLASDFMATGG